MELAIRAMRSIHELDNWGQGSGGEEMSVSDAVEAVLLKDGTHHPDDIWLAGVLVAEPIIWSDRNDYLTDGQHRMCALRAAGVPEVLVCSQ